MAVKRTLEYCLEASRGVALASRTAASLTVCAKKAVPERAVELSEASRLLRLCESLARTASALLGSVLEGNKKGDLEVGAHRAAPTAERFAHAADVVAPVVTKKKRHRQKKKKSLLMMVVVRAPARLMLVLLLVLMVESSDFMVLALLLLPVPWAVALVLPLRWTSLVLRHPFQLMGSRSRLGVRLSSPILLRGLS